MPACWRLAASVVLLLAAAAGGCAGAAGGGAAGAVPRADPVARTGAAAAVRARVLGPAEGERLVYCELPLVFTLKVSADSTPGARLRAATGVLRRGSELGVHRDADEVLYVVRGRGRAIVGADTVPVGPGAVMFVPENTTHGLINDSDVELLEYFVVHAPQAAVGGFRRRAALPGPHCPAAPRAP